MKEEAKAIQEIAKTTGKAIDASRELGGFLSRFIKGSAEQAAGIVEDKLKYMRWERQVRLIKRANGFLNEIGLRTPTKAVPLKIAIPIFQAASLEEDDYLQDLWAKLLVNAGDSERNVEIRRAYLSILEDLDPLGAKILHKIYSLSCDTRKEIWTKNLPDEVLYEKPHEEDLRPSPDVEIAVENLVRLGCLNSAMAWNNQALFCVYPTVLGQRFVEACTLRERK